MSRRRNLRLQGQYPVTRTRGDFTDSDHRGRGSFWGTVTTRDGLVYAMSDALNDLCRYDVVAGGQMYVYYEDGMRTKLGLARRAAELARDAAVRAGTYRAGSHRRLR